MVLSGFGNFRICTPRTRAGGGGVLWSGSDPQSTPILGGGGGSDPQYMEYLVPKANVVHLVTMYTTNSQT